MFKTDFPIFTNHPELVYLDTAASAQKPQAVIGAVNTFYTKGYANIHRGLYPLSVQATEQYEQVRKDAAHFIGAQPHEVVFTHGGTEALNALAQGLTSML